MSSDEQEEKECPLCMEPFELDDYNFFPCQCQYQICRFCWNRIRTEEDPALCPACRQPYSENPVFEPLTPEVIQRIKAEKKLRTQQQRNKMMDCRKHLSIYRVLQKNLVYVVGLPNKLADPEVLKKSEYFGKFGKIVKIAVPTSSGGGHNNQLPHSAYITYSKTDDALRAIQGVNSLVVSGRSLKASLGTTKYCSSFMKGLKCTKQECMYLHEIAEEEVSFTKEDMMKGRHTDLERRLHEKMLARPQSAGQHDTTATSTGQPRAVRRTSHSESDNAPPGFSRRGSQPNGVASAAKEKGTRQTRPLSSSQGTSAPAGSHSASQRQSNRQKSPNSVKPALTPSHKVEDNGSHLLPTNHLPNGNTAAVSMPAATSPPPPATMMMTCHELEQQFLHKQLLEEQFLSTSAPPGFDEARVLSYERQPQPGASALQFTGLFNGYPHQAVNGGNVHLQPNEGLNTNQYNALTHNGVTNNARMDDDDDDDIGFDPWLESSKGLADMLREEQGLEEHRG